MEHLQGNHLAGIASYSLLLQSPLSLSLGCEYRSVSMGIHIDKNASRIDRTENWLYSTEAQHSPQRLQILEHLSFWLTNCNLHIVLSLYFVYLKDVLAVKLPLIWKTSKIFLFLDMCTECIFHRIYAVYFALLFVEYTWDFFKPMKAFVRLQLYCSIMTLQHWPYPCQSPK